MDNSFATPLLVSDSSPLVLPSSHEIYERHAPAPPAQINLNGSEANERDDPRRRLGFYDGVALVLGLQIGSGIFASPSLVARNAGSEPMALLVWCLAGFLAWACAACYIELGTRMPVNGGPQEYLTHCFNDLLGFLASWACIFTVKPCSAAILALFVSDYVCGAFGLAEGTHDFARKSAALSVIALVAGVNCTGNKVSNIATKSTLACKILGVGFVIVVGLAVLMIPSASPSIVPSQLDSLPQLGPGNYTDAILSAMWAYSGWDTVCPHLRRNARRA
jgi:amino acid transporter